MVSLGVTPVLEVASLYEGNSRWYLRDQAEKEPGLCLVPTYHAEIAKSCRIGDRVILQSYYPTKFARKNAIMLKKFSKFAQASLPLVAVKYMSNPLIPLSTVENKSTMTDPLLSIFPKLETANHKAARICPQVFC